MNLKIIFTCIYTWVALVQTTISNIPMVKKKRNWLLLKVLFCFEKWLKLQLKFVGDMQT